MRHLHRSPFRLGGFALLLASMLVGARAHPAAAQVASIDPLVNPVIASRAWDAASGYGALEASRAGLSALLVRDAADATSGYGALEASRAGMTALIAAAPGASAWASAPVDPRRLQAALGALQEGDLGSMQEAALADEVDQFLAWDATSGYGVVEASRAGLTQLVEP